MSADKGRSGRNGQQSGASPMARGATEGSGNAASAPGCGSSDPIGQRDLAVRSAAFMAVAVVLAALALWFVSSTLKGDGEHPSLLSAQVQYTVEVGQMTDRTKGKQMLQNEKLRSLAGDNKLFLRELPGGKVVLCAGTFPAKDDPKARELLANFKNYRLPSGQRVFASAIIVGFGPDGSR